MNGALTDIAAQRTRFALLAYLAIHKSVARDSACALFWPDRGEDRARHTLSQTISQLRHVLGDDWIEPHADPLQITGAVTIDSVDFEAHIQKGEIAQALSLYTGDFLDGFHTRISQEFGLWLEGRRQDLKRLYHRAARDYVLELKDVGEHAAAIAVAERWVLVEPLDDEAHHILVMLLIEAGQRTAAVTVYDAYENRLRETLRLRPLAETQRLIARLRAEASEDAVVTRDVPPATTSPVHFAEPAAALTSPKTVWAELKERRVLRMTGWYLASAFLALQATQLIVDTFTLPRWMLTLAFVMAAAGLPLTVVLSWYYEITPQGTLVRDRRNYGRRDWRVIALGAGGTATVIVGMLIAPILGTALNQPSTLLCAAGRPLPCGREVSLEATRIAVFPFAQDSTLNHTVTGEMHARLLGEGLMHWDDISIVEPQQLKHELRMLTPAMRSTLPFDTMRAIAKRLGAGRFIAGELWQLGDTTRVEISSYDTQSGSRTDRNAARFAAGAVETEKALRRMAQEYVAANSQQRLDLEAVAATSSYAAAQVLDSGFLALEKWDLPTTRAYLEKALQIDAGYAHPRIWLAYVMLWSNDTTDEWRLQAERAASSVSAAALAPRLQFLAHGVAAIAKRDYGHACENYRALLARDTMDYLGWFGLGECLRLNRTVVRDTASPSGWSFVASWQEAIQAYQRAFFMLPSFNEAFINLRASRLETVLFLNRGRVRTGVAMENGDRFGAWPDLVGDTLSLIPYPYREWSNRPQPLRSQAVVEKHRNILSASALAWADASPNNPSAMESLAYALELEGRLTSRERENTAHAAIRRARQLNRDRAADVRLAATETRILFKAGRFPAAEQVATRALRDHPTPSEADALLLSGLAGLVGQGHRMAELLRMAADSIDYDDPASGAHVDIPPAVARTTATLLAYAHMGGPLDSIRALSQRAHAVLNTYVSPDHRTEIHQTGMNRAARMLFPVLGVDDAHSQDLPATSFLKIQMKVAQGDSTGADRDLDSLQTRMFRQNPADVASDGVLTYAQLRIALRDTAEALAVLDNYLAELDKIPRHHFRQPFQPATMVRLMILRAELADDAGDRKTARRWARTVSDLWQSADKEHSRTMRHMRRLARSWYRI